MSGAWHHKLLVCRLLARGDIFARTVANSRSEGVPGRPGASGGRRRLTPIAQWPDADSLESHVRGERVRVVFQQAPPAQLISIVAAAVVGGVLWPVADHRRIVIWFSAITVITLSRIALALAFQRRGPLPAQMPRWEATFVVTLALVSLAWGVGGWWLMPPSSPLHQAVIYFFLMGVAGGAIASYAAHAVAAMVAVTALMVPATVYFALSDVAALRALAVGGLLYLAAAVRSTRTFGFFLRRTFQLSFELHQAYARAREQARTDELTGLANRRAFVEQGTLALDTARRYHRPLSLIMCDIDHFKAVNDSLGHAVGDEALRQVATLLRDAARNTDTAGRVGGEEFAILLPETFRDDAVKLAERLRRDVAALALSHDGTPYQLTCSFGVASQAPEMTDLDTLLSAADTALYRAKSEGRDRVVAHV